MENVRQFLQGVELDNRTAALLTGAACGVGALVVLVRKVNSRQETKEKIRRARNRRAESLLRAEQAVLRYKESVRAETAGGGRLVCLEGKLKHTPSFCF